MTGEIIISNLDQLERIIKPSITSYFIEIGTFIILFVTLVFLIIYTIKTSQIAKQARESNLRPVILREGFITSWQELKDRLVNPQNISLSKVVNQSIPLKFHIFKQIATNINGYIIIDNKKFILLFGSDISTIETTKDSNKKIAFKSDWGWMAPNQTIFAFFIDSKKSINKPNQIIINYKDIEGNEYHTIENELFHKKSIKGWIK